MGFNHSVKVPTQYKRTAAVLKTALVSEKSLKDLILSEKHARLQGMQAVLKKYIDNREIIDVAIEKVKILEDNPRLCPILCKVLVSELIFGLKKLIGESRPVLTVKSYHQKLLEAIGADNFCNKNKTGCKPRYVRINTNVINVSDCLEALAIEKWRKKDTQHIAHYDDFLKAISELEEDEYMMDMHIHELLIFHSKQKHYWACHQFVKDRKFLLQDKATCLVIELLQPVANSILLDMCAAPGMKTIQACNAMQNQGSIFAVELNFERYNLLRDMINDANCKIVKPIFEDALKITDEHCPFVEYILVDPSCSGSGMQNRLSIKPEIKDIERLKKLRTLQVKMLSHAMSAFPHVKRIVYSTCSLYEEENEQVVQRCLELHSDFKLLSGKKALRNKWSSLGNKNYSKIGNKCLHSKPDIDLSDGIFIALFEKQRKGVDNL